MVYRYRAGMSTPDVDAPDVGAADDGDTVRLPGVMLAVDIGAAGFQAGLVSARGVLLDRRRARIEPDAGPESHYTALAGVVTDLMTDVPDRQGVRITAVGASCGGRVARGLELVTLGLLSWRDFPLRSRLEELTGLPVFGDLDAKALALAEGWLGAAQGHQNFLVVTVSERVSGAIVLDGDLVDGHSGNAGHIGHVVVEPGGRRCHCGTQGCLDAEASGEAIDAITGRPATEPTFQIMQRTGRLVGRAAASVCNMCDLSLVVVGGSVALGFGSTFFHSAQVALDEHARLTYTRGARITPSRLGQQGPLIGAGAVGWRGLRRSARAPRASSQPPSQR
jgi:glucokinase